MTFNRITSFFKRLFRREPDLGISVSVVDEHGNKVEGVSVTSWSSAPVRNADGSTTVKGGCGIVNHDLINAINAAPEEQRAAYYAAVREMLAEKEMKA